MFLSVLHLLNVFLIIGFWINYGVNINILPGHKQWLIAFAVQLIVRMHVIETYLIWRSPRSLEACYLPAVSFWLNHLGGLSREIEKPLPWLISVISDTYRRMNPTLSMNSKALKAPSLMRGVSPVPAFWDPWKRFSAAKPWLKDYWLVWVFLCGKMGRVSMQ